MPVVGRDAELALLQRAYRDAVEQRTVRMLTLVGDAGVGKSRLVGEVIDRVAVGARVLVGRCLPYGDGITFWPLRMMVLGAAGIGDDEAPEVALRGVHDALGDAAVAARLASAIGLSKGAFPLAETYWAARRFFEQRAADGPLLVFVDDIHWAGAAFLDLLEHVLTATRGAPILLLTLRATSCWRSGPTGACRRTRSASCSSRCPTRPPHASLPTGSAAPSCRVTW